MTFCAKACELNIKLLMIMCQREMNPSQHELTTSFITL